MAEETNPPQESGQTDRPPDATPTAPPTAAPAAPHRPSPPPGSERPPYRQDRPPGGPERRYGGDREGRPGGRPPYGGGGPRGEGGSYGRRPPPPRRRRRGKVCGFCANKIIYIDYKTVDRLRHFVTDRGKILPRRITGSCARHQRMLTRAIKRARNIALIPFKAK